MAVFGSHAGRSRVVELVNHSLTARPPQRGVEVLACHREIEPINTLIDQRIETLRHYHAKDFGELRTMLPAAEQGPSDVARAAVVVIDGDSLTGVASATSTYNDGPASTGISDRSASTLDRVLRCGRSLDIHTVLSVAQIHDLAPTVAVAQFSSIVEVHEDGRRAWWRRVNMPTSVELELPAKGTGGTPP
ncbi:MAG: hypothetical protein WDA07_10435 [Leucobacter sp.]